MEEIIRVQNQHYIIASSARLTDRVRVLKHGDTFAVFDPKGDITPIGHGEQGLYHEGTRYISRLELRLQDRSPFLLSSSVNEQVAVLSVNLTNPDIAGEEGILLRRNALHIMRSSLLWEGTCYEDLRIRNYESVPVEVKISIDFDADFADIFEVRGFERQRRGRMLDPEVGREGIVLGYEGLDGVVRRLRIRFSPENAKATAGRLQYENTLLPRGEESIHLTFSFETQGGPLARLSFHRALERCHAEIRSARSEDTRLATSNANFNEWLVRSALDLHMMFTRTASGIYPYAGIPWFNAPFGRDGIITALQYLWVNPKPARGVLTYLASSQAREQVPAQDAEPGKILHEARKGELAALGEIPFGQYYGSVDSTPLFVILAGAYFERTGDRRFLEFLWPHVLRAIDWVDRFGDMDGDGFVEYSRKSPRGLVNQGWKDSHDAIFHMDGTLAQGPIALCEVQAYVYAARLRAAKLAEQIGDLRFAAEQRGRADDLQKRFEEAFWSDALGTYGLALDGQKKLCQVRTSNAGHALFGEIADPERALRVANLLVSDSFNSGWGVRTVASTEARYNPMSYHNGSVWPHDNGLIALGMSRYDMPRVIPLKLLSALFSASVFTELHRLPELYCGFRRQPGEGPTLYPVACSPQAWASGCVFMLLQAALGLTLDAQQEAIYFNQPALPESLEELSIRGLQLGAGGVDLSIRRHLQDVEIHVLGRRGRTKVIVTK
jgi:glycogen debranching enzyme